MILMVIRYIFLHVSGNNKWLLCYTIMIRVFIFFQEENKTSSNYMCCFDFTCRMRTNLISKKLSVKI